MGLAPLTGWDPLGLCYESTVSPTRQGPIPDPVPATPQADEDDRILQQVLLKSIVDQGPNDPVEDDVELQAALQESLLPSALSPSAAQLTPEGALLQDLIHSVGLARLDVGSTNLSESGHVMGNQCFYLSIARSWLAEAAQGGGLLIRDSALQLKREIETSVVAARGAAAFRDVGEESEAYTDYLECAVRGDGPAARSAITDLAVVIFVSAYGVLEVYEGRGYSRLPRDQQVANLALVWHRPGHFEAVVAAGTQGKPNLTLSELLNVTGGMCIPTTFVRA